MAPKCSDIKHVILVCEGSDCKKKGAKQIRKASKKAIKKLGLTHKALVVQTACMGLCSEAPLFCLQPRGECVPNATPEAATDLIRNHLA